MEKVKGFVVSLANNSVRFFVNERWFFCRRQTLVNNILAVVIHYFLPSFEQFHNSSGSSLSFSAKNCSKCRLTNDQSEASIIIIAHPNITRPRAKLACSNHLLNINRLFRTRLVKLIMYLFLIINMEYRE